MYKLRQNVTQKFDYRFTMPEIERQKEGNFEQASYVWIPFSKQQNKGVGTRLKVNSN